MVPALKSAIAEFLAVDPASVPDDFRFAGERFQGSVAMFKFQSFAQKRLGRPLPAIPYGAGLAEAVALMGGDASGLAPAPAAATAPAVPAMVTLALPSGSAPPAGIDIEAVAAMPDTGDFRAHPFYSGAFTPEEIAYCVLKPEPKVHFCGMFAAKEALKKAAPAYLALAFKDIEVSHDAAGRPSYRRAGPQGFPPLTLSISHTRETAVAVCVGAVAASAPAAQAPAAVPAGPREASAAPPAGNGRLRDLVLVAGGALLAALGVGAWLLTSGGR